MARRKQKRNKVTNSSASHEVSSGCDTSIDITSSSEAEDWSGMDPDHDWEFKVVGVEIEAARGDEIYETRWPTWSRIDGTTNTWERIKSNPNSVLETSQWDEARQKKVRRLRKQVKRDLGLSKTKRNLTSFPLSPSLSIPISSSLDLISTPTRNHAEFMNEKMDLAEKFRGSGMAHMAKKLQKKELEKRWDILVSELGYKEATKLIKEVEVDTDDDEMDLEEKDDGFEEKSEDGEERGERDEEMGDPDTDDDQQSYRRRSVDDTRSATLSQKQNSTASARRVALTRGARKSVRTRAASRSTSTRSGSSAAISYSSTSASASSSSSYAFSGTRASTSSGGAHASIDDDVEIGGPSPTGSTDAGTEWSCFMCTFKNLPGAIKCIMCDRPNAQLNWVAQSAQSLPVTAAIPSSSSSITPKQRIAPTKPLSMASTMPTTLLSSSSVHTPGTASLTILPWIPPSTSEPPFPSPMAPRPAIPYSSTPALNRVNPISYKMSNRSTQLYSSSSSSNVPSSSLTPSNVSTWSNASNTPNIRSFNIYLPNQVQSRRTDSSSSSGSASNSRNILHSYSDGLAAQDDTRMKETGTGTSATSTPQTDPMNLPGDIPDFINDSMRDVGRNASGSGTGQGQGASRNVTREIKLLPQRNFTSEGVKKPRGLSSGRLGDEWNGQDRSVLGSGSAAASSSSSTAATTPKSKIKFAESKSSNFATPASKAIKSPISTASNSTTTTTLYGSTVTPSTTSTLRHSLETEMGATNIKKPGIWKGKAKETRSNLDLLTLTWTTAAIQAGAAPVTFVNEVDDEDGPPGIRVDFRFLEKLEASGRSPHNDTSFQPFQQDSEFRDRNDGFRYLESRRITHLPQLREPPDSEMFLRCTCESDVAKQEDLDGDGDVAMLFDDSESDTRSHSGSRRRSSSRISHMSTKVKFDAKGKGKSTSTKTALLTCGISSQCGCQEVSELRDKAGRPMRAYTKEGLFVHTSRYNPLSSGIEIIECNQYCHCAPSVRSLYSSCINRVAQKPRRIPIQVFKTVQRGWGVRCFEQDLRTGMVLGCYTGELIHRSTAAKLLGEDKTYVFDLDGKDPPIDEVHGDGNRGENGFDVDEEDLDPNVQMYSIDARRCGNWTRFLNHSCHPNLAVYTAVWDTIPEQNIPHLVFFALDDIPRGEEMTVDYHAGRPLPKLEKTKTKGKRKSVPEGSKGAASETGEGERNRPWGTRECFCGSRRCRGWV